MTNRVDLRNLSVGVYARGQTLWMYQGRSQTMAELAEPGVWDALAGSAEVGDLITVSAKDGTSIVTVAEIREGHVRLAGLMPWPDSLIRIK